MSNNNDLEILINDFLNYSDELKETKIFGFEICFVDDIFQAICDIDKEYADSHSDSLKNIYGLMYPAVDGKIFLYVKKECGVTTYGTVLHEIVHLHDYVEYFEYLDEKDIRKLTEDDVFRYWTEFHAEYLTYEYLITKNKAYINPNEAYKEFRGQIEKLLLNQRIILSHALDVSIRNYGRYIALHEVYCGSTQLYPNGFFLNQDFLNLYSFLIEHRTSKEAISSIDEWEALLIRTEN